MTGSVLGIAAMILLGILLLKVVITGDGGG